MTRRYLSVNILPEQQHFIQLVDKKFLSRIEKGKYCRTNFRDELVIGTFIAKEGAVAYWSALNRHGLTEQFSNTVFIHGPESLS